MTPPRETDSWLLTPESQSMEWSSWGTSSIVMSIYVLPPEVEESRHDNIDNDERRSHKPFLSHSENDWLRTVNVDWARGFSDIVEVGSSKYDFIRIWQNDPVRWPWHGYPCPLVAEVSLLRKFLPGWTQDRRARPGSQLSGGTMGQRAWGGGRSTKTKGYWGKRPSSGSRHIAVWYRPSISEQDLFF